MNEGSQFIDLIFLGIIALMLIKRLLNVLGRSPEDEDDSVSEKTSKKEAVQDNVINLSSHRPLEKEEKLSETDRVLNEIQKMDSTFNTKSFLSGAVTAFKMIVRAFTDCDVGTLRLLLSEDVFKQFSSAIDDRMKSEEKTEVEIVRVVSKEITNVKIIENIANVEVKFVTEQHNIVRDKEGNVIKGSLDRVETITDIWTFSRNLRLKNPNWILVGTKSI